MNTEHMLEHLQALCVSPRPTATQAERRAAEYVRVALQEHGIHDIRIQTFRTPGTTGWTLIPLTAAITFGALLRGSFGKLIGGGLILSAVSILRDYFVTKPAPFAPLLPQAESQNIIARIPAAGEAKRTIFLIGHLDSNKQRFAFPQIIPPLTKPLNTAALIVAALGSVSMLFDALAGRRRVGFWQSLTALLGFGMTGLLLYDESQPYVQGANDNATAVALLLGLAETLKAQPLEHTDVTLLFTGSEEAGCNGMEAYLQQYAPSPDQSYFIDIEMVGTGDLCYITKHGISHLSEYHPAPRITALAAEVAQQHPELGVVGKAMTIVEEVAPLRTHGVEYEAICIAGYDATGMLPNWHRLTDRIDRIEPDTLTRAAQYVYALIGTIDARVET